MSERIDLCRGGVGIDTYSKSKESETEQYSNITDKRENPHVVLGDVSMQCHGSIEAWNCGAL